MNEQNIEKIIRCCPPFDGCSTETLKTLAVCERRRYEAGERISKERLSMLGIVVSGKFMIKSADGERVLMNSVGAGGVFGAATVFLGENEISGITASSKSEVIFVPRAVLDDVFAKDTAVAVAYAKFLSERISFLSKKIISLSSFRADVALAGYICDIANGDDEIKLNCSAAAKKLGLGRTTVYRALKTLEKDGAIVCDGGKIKISDVSILTSRRKNK